MPGSSPKSHSSHGEGSSPAVDPGIDQVIQPDDDPALDDGDSALGDDIESSTASINSSILEYRTIRGRTYHSDRGNAFYW